MDCTDGSGSVIFSCFFHRACLVICITYKLNLETSYTTSIADSASFRPRLAMHAWTIHVLPGTSRNSHMHNYYNIIIIHVTVMWYECIIHPICLVYSWSCYHDCDSPACTLIIIIINKNAYSSDKLNGIAILSLCSMHSPLL